MQQTVLVSIFRLPNYCNIVLQIAVALDKACNHGTGPIFNVPSNKGLSMILSLKYPGGNFK